MAFDNGQSGKKPTRTLTLRERINATAPPTAGMSPDEAAVVQQSEVGLRDAAIKAGRKAPSLRDRINATAAGTAPPEASGIWGNVGKAVLGNPVAKVVLGGLTAIGVPHRAVISGIREAVDVFDSDPETNASFADFQKQRNDAAYGFGTAFPIAGWKGRLIGFGADMVLDPLMWMTMGAGAGPGAVTRTGRMLAGKVALTANEQALRVALSGSRRVAGFDGRTALARLAGEMGYSDEIVAKIAQRGRIAAPADMYKVAGLKKPGLYMYGTRVYIPGSQPLIKAMSTGMVEAKLGIIKFSPIEKLMKNFTKGGVSQGRDLSEIKRALVRGEFAPAEAARWVNVLTQDRASRITVGIEKMYAEGKTISLLRNTLLEGNARSTAARMLDTDPKNWVKLGIVPGPGDQDVYDMLRPIFRDLFDRTEAAMPLGLKLDAVENYLARFPSKRTMEFADKDLSQGAELARQYMKQDMISPAGSFRGRRLVEGSDWYGAGAKGLTAEDVAGGVHRFNEMARPHLGFDFFETDLNQIIRQYNGQYADQMGLARFMKGMGDDDNFRLALEENVLGFDLVKAQEKVLKTTQQGLDDAFWAVAQKAGVVSSVLSKASGVVAKRDAATVAVRVGRKQAVVDAATAGVKALPSDIEIKAANKLARLDIVEGKTAIEAAWVAHREIFPQESKILGLLDVEFKALMKTHDDTVAQIDSVTAAYTKLGGDVGLEDYARLQGELELAMNSRMAENVKFENAIQEAAGNAEHVESILAWAFRAVDENQTLSSLRGDTKRPRGRKASLTDKDSVFSKAVDARPVGTKRVTAPNISAWMADVDGGAKLLAAVDPGGTVSAARLSRMTLGQVTKIIARAQSGTANMLEVRAAGIWVVMRDSLAREGMDPDGLLRLENMTQLLTQAREAEWVSRFGSPYHQVNDDLTELGTKNAVVAQTKTKLNAKGEAIATRHKENYIKAVARQKVLEENVDMLKLQEQFDNLVKLSYRDYIDMGLDLPEEIEGTIQAWASKLNKYADVIDSNAVKVRYLSKNQAITPEFANLTRAMATPDGYRNLVVQLADSVAEYKVHSQVMERFEAIAVALSDMGLAPSASMYDNIARQAVVGDIAAAKAFQVQVGAAVDILRKVQTDVTAGLPEERAGKLLFVLVDIFRGKTPETAAQAAALNAVFPEIGMVVKKKIAANTVGTILEQTDQGRRLSTRALNLVREVEESPFSVIPGIDGAPRKGGRGRAPVRTAQILNEAGVGLGGYKVTGATTTKKAGAAPLYADLDNNLRIVDVWLKKNKGHADFGRIEASFWQLRLERKNLFRYLEEAKAEVAAGDDKFRELYLRGKRAEADEAQAASTGVGVAASKRVAVSRAGYARGKGYTKAEQLIMDSFNFDYGFISSLTGALKGSKHQVDTFFADFLGGSKRDYRLGFTNVKIQDNKLVRIDARTLKEVGGKPVVPTIEIMPGESFVGVVEERLRARIFKLSSIRDNAGTFQPGALREGLDGNRGGFITPRQGMQAPTPIDSEIGAPFVQSTERPGRRYAESVPPVSESQRRVAPVSRIYEPGKWLFAENLEGAENLSNALRGLVGRWKLKRDQYNVLVKAGKKIEARLADEGYEARRVTKVARLQSRLDNVGTARATGDAVDDARAELARVSRPREHNLNEELAALEVKRADGFYRTKTTTKVNNLNAERNRILKELEDVSDDRVKGRVFTEEEETRISKLGLRLQDVGNQLIELNEGRAAAAGGLYARDVGLVKAKYMGAEGVARQQKAIRAADSALDKTERTARARMAVDLQQQIVDAQSKSVAAMYGDDIALWEDQIRMLNLDGAAESVLEMVRSTTAALGLKTKMPAAGASLDDVFKVGESTAKAASGAAKKLAREPFVVSTARTVGQPFLDRSNAISREFFGIRYKVTGLGMQADAISAELANLRKMSEAEVLRITGTTHQKYRTQLGLMRRLAAVRKTLADSPAAKTADEAAQLAGLTVKEAKLVKSLHKLGKMPQSASAELTELHGKFVGAVAAFDAGRLLASTAEESLATAKTQVKELKVLRQAVVDNKAAVDSFTAVGAARAAQLRGLRTQAKAAGDVIPLKNELSLADRGWIAEVDALMKEFSEASVGMPFNLDQRVQRAMNSYFASKMQLLGAEQGVSAAERELRGLRGLEALSNSGGIAQAIPGYTEVMRRFDVGFVQLSDKFYPEIGVREELAKMMQNVHRFKDDNTAKQFKEFMGSYTRFYKAYATLSPGFHVRNAFSNGFGMFAAGGNPLYMLEALGVSRSWWRAAGEGLDFEAWLARDIAPKGANAVHNARMGFEGMIGSGGGSTSDMFRKLAPSHDEPGKITANIATDTSRQLGQRLEAHSRFMLSYDGAKAGMSRDLLVARTQRFLIDYEDVSRGDKFMRQIVPFWMWTSRNFPLQLQNIWMNPKPYRIYEALKQNISDPNEEGTPQWMTDAGSFKLPFGASLYATPDLGFNRIAQQVDELKNPSKLLAQMNPAYRVPMELMGGKKFFGNRPFGDKPVEVSGGMGGALQPFLEALGYGETGPTGKKFVTEEAMYTVTSAMPLLSKIEALFPSGKFAQERGTKGPFASFLGIPVRKLTDKTKAAEFDKLTRALQALVRDHKATTAP